MMPKPSIIGLILTFNEERNIKDCITSLKCCSEIIVFDSYSNDQTVEISKQCGAKVFQRTFDNYALQRNAALKHVPKKYDWVLMIDADERLTPELSLEIIQTISKKPNANTLYRVRRKDQFMNQWIKHSSGYPTWFPRLFKNGKVTVTRDINEEYTTIGEISSLSNHLIHYPFNKGINWWFERHNKYSSMEAKILTKEFNEHIPWSLSFSKDPVERRKFQKQFLYRLPFRPLIIFFLLYVLRKGFLDGLAGYRYCKMRMIYEMMIDLKINELKASNYP